jgi:cytoskeletal protein RodZ
MSEEQITSLGAQLKAAREAKGLSLAEMQTQTKIQIPFLQAIEADDLEALPGDFYARAFIRRYASAVGLDSEQLLPATAPSHTTIDLSAANQEFGKIKHPGTRTVGVVLSRIFAILIGIGALMLIWWGLTHLSFGQSAPQTQQVSMSSANVPVSSSSMASSSSSTQASSASKKAPLPDGQVNDAFGTTTFDLPKSDQRALTIDAGDGPIWLQITADTGEVLLNTTIEANQKQTVNIPDNVRTASVNLGNTLNVTTQWNGQALDFKQQGVNPWTVILNLQ